MMAVEQTSKGRIELVWGDRKCPEGLAPHQVGQLLCESCKEFDGGALCEWHLEHTYRNLRSGRKLDYHGNIVPREGCC